MYTMLPASNGTEEWNRILAEQINDEMKSAVMPVTVFVGIEIFLGFFGNIAVLYVFFFRYHMCNFRYFVLCLALTDLTSTVTTMPGEMVTQLYWYVYPVPLVCKIKSFFNVFTVTSEAFCLLTIAVDRYRKICHPHGWQIKQKVAKWLCVPIYATSFVVALPVAFYWGTHKEVYRFKGQDVKVTVCEKDEQYMHAHTTQPIAYSSSVSGLMVVSLACMFVLYIFIARKLVCGKRKNNPRSRHVYRSPQEDGESSLDHGRTCSPSDIEINQESSGPKRSGESTGRNSRESKVRRKTLIMFILTLIFIVTTILYTVLLIFIAKGILSDLSDTERAVYFIFFRLYFINHVINPFVYGVLDANFRKAFLHCKKSVRGRSTSS